MKIFMLTFPLPRIFRMNTRDLSEICPRDLSRDLSQRSFVAFALAFAPAFVLASAFALASRPRTPLESSEEENALMSCQRLLLARFKGGAGARAEAAVPAMLPAGTRSGRARSWGAQSGGA